MSRTLDLLEDGFPHGTVDGYRAGCRGSRCPALISCRDVRIRSAGDPTFRARLDAGLSLAEILDSERADANQSAERSRAASAPVEAPRRAAPIAPRTPRPEPRPTAATARPKPARVLSRRSPRTSAQVAADERAKRDARLAREERARGRAQEREAHREARRAAKAAREKTIREMHARHCTDAEISAELGVSATRVYQLRHDLGLRAVAARPRKKLSAAEKLARAHGTPHGYALGCHDRSKCEPNEHGTTCSDAWNKAALARKPGRK